MRNSKLFKTILIPAMMLAVMLATPSAISLAAPPCPPHNLEYSASFLIDGQPHHNVYCTNWCWVPEANYTEPCVFHSMPPADGDVCDLCHSPYNEACVTGKHYYSDWTRWEAPKGTINHRRECVECYYVQEGECSYDGGTICTVCQWDSKGCLTCGGTYTIKCGDNFSYCYDDVSGSTCGNFMWLTVANDITFGFCDCGCDVRGYAQFEIDEVEAGTLVHPDGEVRIYNCDDNCGCTCQWDCPDCEAPAPPAPPSVQPPQTTPTAPKTGEDLNFFVWGIGIAMVGMVVCVVVLIKRKMRI